MYLLAALYGSAGHSAKVGLPVFIFYPTYDLGFMIQILELRQPIDFCQTSLYLLLYKAVLITVLKFTTA